MKTLFIQRSDGSVIDVSNKEGQELLAKHPNWKIWKKESDGLTPKQFMCPVCFMVFKTKNGLVYHKSIHYENRPRW